jgi:sugar/nucleoside kinase (ribokinase family)
VVGLGQVMIEFLGIGPRSPETVVEMSAFSMQSGGAIGTTLATVGALGAQARYVGRLSDDDLGNIALRGLKAFGVDVSQVLIEPGKVSPASFILVDDRTARRFVRYTRGNTTPLVPGELPRNMFDDAHALVVDGRNPAPQIAAAERAKGLGLTVVLDARHLGPGMGELLDLCDVVIGNERFAAEFSHSADNKRALSELVKMGPRMAVITLGEEARSASRTRPSCAAPRWTSTSSTARARARSSAVPSSTACCKAGRSCGACRSPTPPPA